MAAFCLYAVTAAPSVATIFDDSLEFHVVLPTLGIAHPSGYPLYTLLGRLVSSLPFGTDPAGWLNLLSALFAAAAVAFLFLVARCFSGSRPAAAIAAVIFALSPAWWSQATIAEVYALHGLLLALFLYFLLRWDDDRLTGGSDRWLHAAALTGGLGLAHHRMIALLAPAALVFILWSEPRLLRQPRRWIAPLVLALAPLLFYAYLPLRGQTVTSLDGAYAPTLRGTVDWILASGYRVFITGNPFNIDRGWSDYVALTLNELGALTMIAALLGLVSAIRLQTKRAVFLLLATLSQIGFGTIYKVQDIAVFFIPAFMLVCIWAAWGLTPYFDLLAQRAATTGAGLRVTRRFRPAVIAAFILPVFAVMLFEPVRDAVRDWPQRDRSAAWSSYDLGQDMVDSAAAGGRIVGLGGEITLVRYFRDVLGQRPDLRVTRADGEAERINAVEAAMAAGEPVYLTRELAGAAQRYSLDAAGSLIRVSPKAAPAAAPGGTELGAGLVLVEGHAEARTTRGGVAVRVRLSWAATAPIGEEFKTSVRLLDPAGETLVAQDQAPVHFAYPTTAWVPGETVEDVIDLAARPGDPACSGTVLVILYRAADAGEVGRVTLPVGCIGN